MLVCIRDRSLSDEQRNSLMVYRDGEVMLRVVFGGICKFDCNKPELKSCNKFLEAAKVC